MLIILLDSHKVQLTADLAGALPLVIWTTFVPIQIARRKEANEDVRGLQVQVG